MSVPIPDVELLNICYPKPHISDHLFDPRFDPIHRQALAADISRQLGV